MQSLQQVFMITSRQQLVFNREHRHRGPRNIIAKFLLIWINEDLELIKEQNCKVTARF